MRQVRSAMEALDATAEVATTWVEPVGRLMAQALYGANADRALGASFFLDADGIQQVVVEAAQGLTVWVSPDVRDVVAAAARTLGNEPLRADDPPADAGVIWIGGGTVYWNHEAVVNGLEAEDKEQLLADPELRAWIESGVVACGIGWVVVGGGVIVYSLVPPPAASRDQGLPWWIVDLWGWHYDMPWEEIPGDDTDGVPLAPGAGPDDTSTTIASNRRWLIALWRFMASEIVETEPAPLPRQARRRAQRCGVRSDVTVVRLRRVRHDEHGNPTAPQSVAWTVRWWVAGHWRTIRRGTTRERKVWVRPYVKGPEDAPMATPKRRIVSVER